MIICRQFAVLYLDRIVSSLQLLIISHHIWSSIHLNIANTHQAVKCCTSPIRIQFHHSTESCGISNGCACRWSKPVMPILPTTTVYIFLIYFRNPGTDAIQIILLKPILNSNLASTPQFSFSSISQSVWYFDKSTIVILPQCPVHH